MSMRNHIFALLLGGAVVATSGCTHRVVSAAMPAPMPPHAVNPNQTPPSPDQPPVIPPPGDPKPQGQLLPPDPASQPAAPAASRVLARSRAGSAVSSEADPSKSNPEPLPDAPVIAPVLSQREVANAMRVTNNDQRVAERALQIARSRRLNPGQADLFDKVKGFLDQTEDAKKAADWVRAQNLAHKAQILALDLMKSF